MKQDLKFPVPAPPGGGYITKMETDIVDAATGDPVPISRLMLHHIVFASIGKPDSTCHGQGFLGFDSRPDPYAELPRPAVLRRRRGARQALASQRLRLRDRR